MSKLKLDKEKLLQKMSRFKMLFNIIFIFLLCGSLIESNKEFITDIYQSEECKKDISRLCDHIHQGSNLEVLQCLQRSEKVITSITKPCQHFLWQFKEKFLNKEYFNLIYNNNCKNEFTEFKKCSKEADNNKVVCLIKHRGEIVNKLCHMYLEETASIVFSDIALVNNFLNNCNDDIESLKCGRLQGTVSMFIEKPINLTLQAETINCLVMSQNNVRPECRKQILRLGELQSDDFHHNPSLFYACREDREIFCHEVDSGNSQVYRCLEKNKYNNKISEKVEDTVFADAFRLISSLTGLKNVKERTLQADSSTNIGTTIPILTTKMSFKNTEDSPESKQNSFAFNQPIFSISSVPNPPDNIPRLNYSDLQMSSFSTPIFNQLQQSLDTCSTTGLTAVQHINAVRNQNEVKRCFTTLCMSSPTNVIYATSSFEQEDRSMH